MCLIMTFILRSYSVNALTACKGRAPIPSIMKSYFPPFCFAYVLSIDLYN